MNENRVNHKQGPILSAFFWQRELGTAALALSLLLSSWLAGPLQAAPAGPDTTEVVESVSIAFSPPAVVIQGCETLPIQVRVNDVTGLYGVDVKVAFDPTVLEVVDADPGKPGIQVQDGSFLSPDFVVTREADTAGGTLEYAMTQASPSLPVSGSGVLFTILFRAKAGATGSTLDFIQTDLVDLDGLPLAVTVMDGSTSSVAPASSVLGISTPNDGVAHLFWTTSSGVSSYQLYRNPAPYFVLAAPAHQVTGGTSCDDLGALGSPAENHYYVVQSTCASGFGSPPSNRVGEFDFTLVPGLF